jgi:hypothetical protein
VLLEWDAEIPDFDRVHREAKKATKYIRRSPAGRARVRAATVRERQRPGAST